MFLRKHVVARGDHTYVSYRLCRTIRDGSKVRQEIVANLGKLSTGEAERIGAQLLAIAGKTPPQYPQGQQGPACLYGGPLLVRRLMELARLPELLQPLGQTHRRMDLERTITVALCAQLLSPGSELSTCAWQDKLLFTQPPYQIPYQHFLRALDVLADHHHQIEDALFARVQHLFNQRVDLVFYDLTSSYFEGDGPADLARRGYSRDGRPDCVQVVVGLAVTKDGFPIAYRVHAGNTVDAKTLQQMAQDFRQRFQVDRCLVVGDSGLLSKANTDKLEQLGVGYLSGMGAKRHENQQRLTAIRDGGGKYVLQSSSLELSAQDAAVAYRQLEVVEDSFRHLKDTLQLRPIYHRHPRRVMGHIGLCVLALFLLRLLEDRMMAAGICDPAGQIIQAVEQLQAVPVRFDEREVWPVPHVTTKTAAIFHAVGVEDVRACFQRDLQTNHLSSPD